MGYPPGQPPPGYGGGYPPPPPEYGGGYPPAPQPHSSTPQVLSIIGIICWFCFAPASVVLGLIAQNQFRRQGRPATIAKVAWIGGIVSMALGVLAFFIRMSILGPGTGTY